MFEITVRTEISAAHHLRGYEGKCEMIHGHNYRVEVTVGSEHLNQLGLSLDFKTLKEKLRQVTDRFDHSDLNRADDFSQINPSCENLARVIYKNMQTALQGVHVKLVRVRVFETDGCCVTYYE